MIDWLQSVDVSLFRFINSSLSNSFFDWLMASFSGSGCLTAILVLICFWLLAAGGARGRLCVLMLLLALCFGNWIVCDAIKNLVRRPRPFQSLPDVHLRIGMGGSFSMPSSHAANWFSATVIFFVYYRRTIWGVLPVALLVCLSRVYNGVHYPSDVFAGAAVGLGYSAAILWGMERLWQWIGPRCFPLWWERLPSLLQPVVREAKPEQPAAVRDAQWIRLGYILAGLFFILRLAYLGLSKIELTQDEAYQWLWSKHLAWSYYSKPPLIACAQFLGAHLWGDNEFGVRFFSPVIAAVLSVLVLRFLAREAGGRVAFIVFLIFTVTPLMAVGATILTVDPLSVLFWTAALLAGWRASQPDGTTRQWLWVGLWMGLGFLSKYTNLVQYVCWVAFFALWPPARRHLRRPGPYVAMLIGALCCLPVVLWNARHGWITVKHVASDGRLGEVSHRTYVVDFLLSEAAVLHPVFFVAMLWAAVAFWRRGRRDPLQLYLFSMGAPLFFLYFMLSWHSRIQPNWIAPSVVPLFCLMGVYWAKQYDRRAAILKPALLFGLVFGALTVVFLHAPNLIEKLLARPVPAKFDLLHRARGWKEVAAFAGEARRKLEAEGSPAFIIGQDYGITSEISFYLPEAKNRILTDPLVFFYATSTPENQFYFWPNYLGRSGQNAIFVRDLGLPSLRRGWFSLWWHHDNNIFVSENPAIPLPAEVRAQFDSFADLGIRNIVAHGALVRRVQLVACRHLH